LFFMFVFFFLFKGARLVDASRERAELDCYCRAVYSCGHFRFFCEFATVLDSGDFQLGGKLSQNRRFVLLLFQFVSFFELFVFPGFVRGFVPSLGLALVNLVCVALLNAIVRLIRFVDYGAVHASILGRLFLFFCVNNLVGITVGGSIITVVQFLSDGQISEVFWLNCSHYSHSIFLRFCA